MSDAVAPNDTIVTRFLGITLAVMLMFTFVAIAHNLGWHPVVGGILTGLSGAVLGASGTSVNGANMAAIYGWAGGTNFILGLAMFLGLSPHTWLFG